MAKAAASTAASQTPSEPKTDKGKKMIIILLIIFIIILLLATLVVAVIFIRQANTSHNGDTATAPAEQVISTGVDLNKPPTFVTLDPFVVNLVREQRNQYLQTTIALRTADAKTAEALKNFMPAIRNSVNLVLSGKTASEISTTEGKNALSEEIMRKINEVLGYTAPVNIAQAAIQTSTPPIQAVLFTTFIIQ